MDADSNDMDDDEENFLVRVAESVACSTGSSGQGVRLTLLSEHMELLVALSLLIF